MTDRIPLDHLTSDQLDQLYNDLDRYEEIQGEMNEHATNQARQLAELTSSRDEWKWRAENAQRGARVQRERAEQAEAKVADYENRITWHTTCASCARTLDSSIRETERREHAEAALDGARDAAAWIRRNYPALTHANNRLTAALDQPTAGPAATGAAGHQYLSTSCLHGQHNYCSNTAGIAGPKKPAQCKFCTAPCQCPCHSEQPNPA